MVTQPKGLPAGQPATQSLQSATQSMPVAARQSLQLASQQHNHSTKPVSNTITLPSQSATQSLYQASQQHNHSTKPVSNTITKPVCFAPPPPLFLLSFFTNRLLAGSGYSASSFRFLFRPKFLDFNALRNQTLRLCLLNGILYNRNKLQCVNVY